MRKQVYFLLLLITLLGGSIQVQAGGISLNGTRVIYNEKDKGGATIVVNNTADSASYLIQSWVSEYGNVAKPALFMVSPPLFRLDKGKGTLRITRSGGNFPSDRESLFSLNVKAIPGESESVASARGDKGNVLKFSFLTQIKLFWRPAGLTGVANDAYKQLTFSRDGKGLKVSNPTPYYINIHDLSVGGEDVTAQGKLIAPFSAQHYNVKAATNKVSFRVLNDMGVMSEPSERNVQ
jgi:fimbrial chaperone protein